MFHPSPLRFFLLAVTIVVSFPRLHLAFPVTLPMPQQRVDTGTEQSKLRQSPRVWTDGRGNPIQRLHRSNVKAPTISRSSPSDYELQIEDASNSLSDEKNRIVAENHHMLYGLQSQNVVTRLSWIQNTVQQGRLLFERVADMISVSTDHSQPHRRSTMYRRPNHDFISRFIFSHDKEKNIRGKSMPKGNKSLLNSPVHHGDMQVSKISKPQTSKSFDLLDPEKNQGRMNEGRRSFTEYSPTTTSLTQQEISRTGPSLSVLNYLKTTRAKYVAAAPCESTTFWFPNVLRTLEREGVRLVFYCVNIGVSELGSQEIKRAFSGFSALTLGGIINTNLDTFEDVFPRNLDVVISWFGIRSWGARKGLRFVKALHRSGVKRALFTSMCSNPGDEMDKPWTESYSKVTPFWSKKANRRIRRNLNDCSQMVVYALN